MSEIRREDAPALLLDMVPESAEYIAELYGMPASDAVKTDHPLVGLYAVLAEALTEPIMLPQLKSESPDADLLQRCFDYTEQLLTSPTESVRGAAYFQILESLLGEDVPFQKAFPYMRKETWERTLLMLKDYEVDVPGVTDR